MNSLSRLGLRARVLQMKDERQKLIAFINTGGLKDIGYQLTLEEAEARLKRINKTLGCYYINRTIRRKR